jgi:hypothetical protein
MLREVRTFIMRQIVDDVPADMDGCLDCGAVQCVDQKYNTCQYRLAREATLKAAHATADEKP